MVITELPLGSNNPLAAAPKTPARAPTIDSSRSGPRPIPCKSGKMHQDSRARTIASKPVTVSRRGDGERRPALGLSACIAARAFFPMLLRRRAARTESLKIRRP